MEEIFDKLTKKIKGYNSILIISHKNTDLDGLASSILMCQVAQKFGKNARVFLNEKNANVKKVDNLFAGELLTSNCETFNPEDTLVLILDTNSYIYIEEPRILEVYKHFIIIDHHIKGDDYFDKAEMSYVNSNLSSIIEFMTFYIKHINFAIDENLATLMLAGLEIDTNSFNFKTTPNTYKAAGILVELGASLKLKQSILRDSRENILKRNELLKKSYVYHNVISICVLDDGIYEPVELAQVADELLHFKNIEIAFCLGYISKGHARVSIRSLGNYNAQEFALKLGGGGSLSAAAAPLNCSLMEAEAEIKKMVGDIE